MILKFLPNKKGGSTASIDYLLNKKRVQNGTAKILSGDEQNTRDIINSITKKQKVTFGVLSFQEKDIPEQQKKELMQEFEKTFFAGMKKEQYNILWVEHTDKGRLELNFIIPKVELSTGKTFNPYYHKTDFHLADLFERTANLKYNFTDPKAEEKKATIQGNKKALGLFKGYRNLDKKLKELVGEGDLQSRDDILELLKDNNIEVTKVEDNQIEVKLEGNKKPRYLKGGIYTDGFTSVDELRDIGEEQAKRERAFASRNHEAEHREASKRLERAVSKRADFYAEEYREPRKRSKATERNQQENIGKNYEAKRESNQDSRQSEDAGKGQEKAREPKPMAEDKGKINDRTRRTFTTRARERETILTRTRKRTREPRTSLYEQFREPRTSLYEQAQSVMRDRANERAARARTAERDRETISDFGTKIDGVIKEYSVFEGEQLQQFEQLTRAIQANNGKSEDFEQSIKEFIKNRQEQERWSPSPSIRFM